MLLSRCDLHNEIYKGVLFRKNVGEVTVLVLFTLSDNALHLYEVLPSILKGFRPEH